MGPEILLPYSEDPNNGSYPEWVQYSLQSTPKRLESVSVLPSDLRRRLS
jgi:hypothetical protein